MLPDILPLASVYPLMHKTSPPGLRCSRGKQQTQWKAAQILTKATLSVCSRHEHFLFLHISSTRGHWVTASRNKGGRFSPAHLPTSNDKHCSMSTRYVQAVLQPLYPPPRE